AAAQAAHEAHGHSFSGSLTFFEEALSWRTRTESTCTITSCRALPAPPHRSARNPGELTNERNRCTGTDRRRRRRRPHLFDALVDARRGDAARERMADDVDLAEGARPQSALDG